MIQCVAVGVGADVGVQEESLAVFEQPVGILEVGFAFADGFDFGAAEGDAGLEFVEQKVVVAGGAVNRGVALAGGDGIAGFRLFRGGWADGMGALACQESIPKSMLARSFRRPG